MALIVNHESLKELFESKPPRFVPTNGCLSDKKDRALSLCLLAAFKAIEIISISSCDKNNEIAATPLSSIDSEIFTAAIITELKGMGLIDPLSSIKEGGVGKDMIDYVADRFLYSVRGGGQCPATLSVIGALAAQETIKAITSVHVPISQFLMFESLDSILLPLPSTSNDDNHIDDTSVANSSVDPSTSTVTATATVIPSVTSDPSAVRTSTVAAIVYGEEIAAELASMKIFVVGSGAIGCELLKTFALLGVGVGSGGGSDVGVESYKGRESNKKNDVEVVSGSGLWDCLSEGGIVLADMDQIERSNLNRQLLFREKHVGQAKAVVAAETIKHVSVLSYLSILILIFYICYFISSDLLSNCF